MMNMKVVVIIKAAVDIKSEGMTAAGTRTDSGYSTQRGLYCSHLNVIMMIEVTEMNDKRRKELILEYKNRKPEMGVISYRCMATGESFLGISKDTRADFNSTNIKLESNHHPNRRMLELWQKYGKEGFEISVIKVLEYKDPLENYTKELEALREECFAVDAGAVKIWR